MYNEKLNIIKTIYNKGGVMIKTQKNVGTFCYVGSVRIELDSKIMTVKKAQDIAPLLKMVYERAFKIGKTDGYKDGYRKGQIDLQKGLRELLGIEKEDK